MLNFVQNRSSGICRATLVVAAMAAVFSFSATPAAAGRVNFAKYQKVTASVHNSTYVADFAVDGIASNFHSWRTGDNPGPRWLELSYPRPVTLASAHLYSGLLVNASPTQVWQNFRFQYHDGAGWIDIPGSPVTGNTSPEVNIVFSEPATSNRFRFLGSDNGSRSVRQLAMFPPNPDGEGHEQGFPIGTGVVLNLAYKRPATASSAVLGNEYGPGYAKNAFDGHIDNKSRWLCTSAAGEFIEVDLLADHRIGSAHVHTGFIDPNDPERQTIMPMPDFTLQSWNGSAWLAIPGAEITSNTEVARIVNFTESVTTSRVRLVTTSAFNARLQELLIFPPRDGGYEPGREVINAPPPTTHWGTYSDANHLLRCNISSDYRLAYTNGNVVFASGGSGGRTAQGWQLLRNYRDGSYRIRHNVSGQCLALAAVSFADNNLVVLEDYSAMPHQDWFLEPVDATHFRIINAYSGMALQSRASLWSNGNPMAVRPPDDGSGLQQWRAIQPQHHPKKGIAATNNIPDPPFADPTATWMQHFHAHYQNTSWSYSWGRQRSAVFPYMGYDHTFNPMQWGNFNFAHGTNQGPLETIRNDLQSNPKPASLMGFNEPDGSKQANMTVEVAIQRWPRLEAMEVPLVSPGPVNAPNAWLTDFYQQADQLGYRVDSTSVHWYKGPNSGTLINDLLNVYNTYGRPIWLTEFSVVRWSGGATWTHADNYHFLAEFLWRAESLPWLARYSLFNFRENASGPNQDANDPPEAPRSNSIRSDGTLTPFGELYATWDNVAQVLANKAYHVHNRGRFQRMQSPAEGSTPHFVTPDDSGPGTQWFLVPGNTANTHRIITTRDGRPLIRPTGETVRMGTVGQETAATEWSLIPVVSGTNHDGWYFIEHPLTNQRLRNNGDGTYGMVPAGNTGVDIQWRFIVPIVIDPVAPPAIPTGLSTTPSFDQISLVWDAVEGALTYTVQRSETSGGPWQTVAGDLTETTWTDEGLPAGQTYYYQVIAGNVLGDSNPSIEVSATTFHPFATYEGWVQWFLDGLPPAEQAPDADPDNDGKPNLLEFAFLTDPVTPGGNPFRIDGADADAITLEFPWNWRADGYVWQLLHGQDLSDIAAWPAVVPLSVTATRDGDIDLIRVTAATDHLSRGFYVLKVLGE